VGEKSKRAVRFHLADPEQLLRVLREALEYARGNGNCKPVIYLDGGGDLRHHWTKHAVDARHHVTLGYATFKKSTYTLTLTGPFFRDCEDEVLDVCAGLGVNVKIND